MELFGGAGHSIQIAEQLSLDGTLIGIDRDIEAINHAKEQLAKFKNVIYVKDNHNNIKSILENLELEKVDGILLDLGVSSYQLDEETRGFSYMKDSLLDMRMDKSQDVKAYDVINTYSEEELSKIIFEYGEEKFARRIARNICEYRKTEAINTTAKLVEIIEKSVSRTNAGHPAKRTFQAIRIEVNDELKPLYNTIVDSIDCLKDGGRLCVITFHSLEDRIVKNAYKDMIQTCTCPKDIPYCVCGNKPKGEIITRKPILPTEEEMEQNPRSRSAKLRVFERCNEI